MAREDREPLTNIDTLTGLRFPVCTQHLARRCSLRADQSRGQGKGCAKTTRFRHGPDKVLALETSTSATAGAKLSGGWLHGNPLCQATYRYPRLPITYTMRVWQQAC